MSLQKVAAWGRLTAGPHDVVAVRSADDVKQALHAPDKPVLAAGMGRSYGDVCLNAGGRLLTMAALDRFVAADWISGTVVVEAGLTIDQFLQVSVPKGWFIPVTPGTKFVSLAGALANDVHGKNHHGSGTIGRFVRRILLARSNGEIVETSPSLNAELFAATVGGLGLTGVMLTIELSLQRLESAYLDVETIALANIEEFLSVNRESVDAWPYTVAWVDCFAKNDRIGQGLYMRAKPCATGALDVHRPPRLSVPIDAPSVLLNGLTMRAFNAVYRSASQRGISRTHYNGFFYPLDFLGHWNKLYGARGFYQFQCVVPASDGDAIKRILAAAADAGQGSFLVVLKTFGDVVSPGALSFPCPGITLALDFPNKSESTRRLLDRLNAIAAEAGGRMYPAKDATMTGAQFRLAYSRWEEVERHRDPAIMSDFWRRVSGVAT